MAEKTVIRCEVQEQKLVITEHPAIASGGVNEVEIIASFSSHWEDMAISLIAYDTGHKAYASLVDADGKAVVRSEALLESGQIQFGFAGVIDGEIVRTSTRVNYTIRLGLLEEDSALIDSELTPTLWQEILSELAAERAAYESVRVDMDTVIAAVKSISKSVESAAQSASDSKASADASAKSADESQKVLDEINSILGELVNGEKEEF